MRARVVEIEFHQPLNGHAGLKVVEVERLFLAAQAGVNPLQHGQVEALLAAEVVVDHALVGFGVLGDLVYPPAKQPLGGEFVLCRLENGLPRLVRVPAAAVALCFLRHRPSCSLNQDV